MIPPRTVLATVDFSESSRTALTLAARLARHTAAALHVVHAEHPMLDAAAEQAGIRLTEETRDELARFISGSPPAADCSAVPHVAAGAPVDVVLALAARVHADLIVAGSHGMSGTERLLFGSTTEGLLRHAPVSVLVAPAVWQPPRAGTPDLSGMGPVIAGVDPADVSTAGARAACRLAAVLRTTVDIVHIVPALTVLERWRVHADRASVEREGAARADLERLVQELRCEVPVTLTVRTGDVAGGLAAVAGQAEDRAPLLVLGRKTSGTPGAIAYRALMLAKVPVWMSRD